MKSKNILMILIPVLFIAGCTTSIKSKKVNIPSSENPIQGILYTLPKAEFEVTTSFQIKECRLVNNKIRFKIEESSKVAITTVNDLSNTYVIDMASFNIASKASDVEFKFHDNGAIQSINSTIDDKTSDIAINVLKAAGKIALYSSSPMYSALARSGDRTKKLREPCSDKTRIAINKYPIVKSALEASQKRVKKQLESIQSMREHNATAGSLNGLFRELEVYERDLLRKQKTFTEYLSQLTITTTKKFSNSYNVLITPEAKTMKKKIDTSYIQDFQNKLSRRFTVGDEKIKSLPDSPESSEIDGILYRQPATVKVKICDENNPNKCNFEEEKKIPGIGILAYLPFRNKTFQTNTLEADFTENGMLTRVKYVSNAPAENMTTTANTLIDEYKSYKDSELEQYQNYEDQKIKSEQLAYDLEVKKIQNKIDLLTKLEELEKLKLKSTILNNESSLTNLQTEMLELQIENEKKQNLK